MEGHGTPTDFGHARPSRIQSSEPSSHSAPSPDPDRQVHQQWWLPTSDMQGRHRHGLQRKAPVLPSYCSGSSSPRLTPRSVRGSQSDIFLLIKLSNNSKKLFLAPGQADDTPGRAFRFSLLPGSGFTAFFFHGARKEEQKKKKEEQATHVLLSSFSRNNNSRVEIVVAIIAMATNNSSYVKPSVQLDAAVFGAAVQLPTFDKNEPASWFCVAEANFALRKVTDSATKYFYVLSKLDPATLKKLSAFLQILRGNDPYMEIKRKLCKAFQPPPEQKLDALLAINEAGDERPSEFEMELQRLLAGATAEDLLKRIFLRSIKPSIVTAITASLKSDFETLVAAADEAWTVSEASRTTTASVAAVSHPQGPPSLRGGRGGRQRGSRNGTSETGVPVRTETLCSFHRKFGDSARKCSPACPRWGEQNRNRDTQATQVFQVEEALDGEDSNVGSEN